jgi:hypothetical protein
VQNLNCRAPGPPTFLPCSAWIIYYKASGGVIELIHDSYEAFPSLCGDQSEVIHVPHHIKSAMQSSRAVKAAHVLIYHPRNYQKQIDPLYLRLFTQLSYVYNERRPTRCAGGLRAALPQTKDVFSFGSYFRKRLRRCDPAHTFELGPSGPSHFAHFVDVSLVFAGSVFSTAWTSACSLRLLMCIPPR